MKWIVITSDNKTHKVSNGDIGSFVSKNNVIKCSIEKKESKK
jgi:hypothetical protein